MSEPYYLTGTLETDLKVLIQLDDRDLVRLCQTNSLFSSICSLPELWFGKIIQQFGPQVWKRIQQITQQSAQRIYLNFARYPRTIAGANAALILQDLPSSLLFESQRIFADINNFHNRGLFILVNRIRFAQLFRINDELLNYLKNTNMGPVVAGRIDQSGKAIDVSSISNTQLQDVLYSLQPEINGELNPLYGVFNEHVLTKLLSFILFSQEWHLTNPNRSLRMSDEMRTSIPNTLEALYDLQIQEEIASHPEEEQKIRLQGANYRELITNPNAIIRERNNEFLDLRALQLTRLSKIIAAASLPYESSPNSQEEINRIYSWLLGGPTVNPDQKILIIELAIISIARKRASR